MSPPQRLRILMTADAVGGVWSYATTLARGLCRRGHRVHVVTLGPAPRQDQIRAAENVHGLTLETTDLALEWIDPEGHDLGRTAGRLRSIAQRVEPDVIHLNGYREALSEWDIPVLVAAHSCVRSWWRAARNEEPWEQRWLVYMDNVRTGLDAADAWVAPTAAFRNELSRLYAPRHAGHVIWNGLEPRLPSAHKESFILAAGRLWDEAKNVGILARIASRVPWPVEIAGPLSDGQRAVGIPTSNIVLFGEMSREALADEMARAEIFVAPAVYEPFGLSVLEAAASGCALVVSDIDSFRELWEGAALFVDPRDASALGAALTHLTRNTPLRQEMQARARRRARRYSAAAMARAYEALYAELQGNTSSSRPAAVQLVEVSP